MTFQIHALPEAPFRPLHALSDADLAAQGARRVICDAQPGYPCRVSLEDAAPGERLLLLNHEYLSAASPYRGTHAIYVRETARQAHPGVGEVPASLATRLLSVRAFGADDMMRSAEVLEGAALAGWLEGAFADPSVAYIHVHNARQGCFAARVTRAGAG